MELVQSSQQPEVVFEDMEIMEISNLEDPTLQKTNTDTETVSKAKRSLSFLRRQKESLEKETELSEFLTAHGFRDVHQPRSLGCCLQIRVDKIYPIHIAARDGNHKLLRLLLRAGADPQQKTSRGETALHIAQQRNYCGSHDQVLALLKAPVRLLSARDLLTLTCSIPTKVCELPSQTCGDVKETNQTCIGATKRDVERVKDVAGSSRRIEAL